MGIFLITIVRFLISIMDCIEYMLIGYIILGWLVFFGVIKNRDSVFLKIYVFLMTKVEPLLGFIRRFLPPIYGLDFSVLVVFLALHLSKALVIQIASMLARALYG